MTLTEKTKKDIIIRIDSLNEWDKVATEVEGINLIKTPSVKNKDNVFVELNVGKKGIYLKNFNELIALKKIVTNPLAEDLIKFIDENYNNNNQEPLKLEREEE